MKKNPPRIARSICRDVQTLLYDYETRELGPARSEFVREHVRKCEACREELVSIRKTLDILTMARSAPVPARLSVQHRNRMQRAVMHPVLDWICRHNVFVAVTAMLLTILLAVLFMRYAMNIEKPDDSDAVLIDLSPNAASSNGAPLELQRPLQDGVK